MSTVRVVARIRPLLPHELERDVIVSHDEGKVTIPNPRNEAEKFNFNFNAVHGMDVDQAGLFVEGEFTMVWERTRADENSGSGFEACLQGQ